jgi:hypothetical protein
MKITLIKTLGNNFKVAYNSDYEIAKKIPVNEPIEYEWKKKRNYKFHKKFFALIDLVYENQEQFNNKELLRKQLTIKAGFYDTFFDIDGVEQREAHSISFASMDENEFQELYARFIDAVFDWLGIEKQDLIDEIDQYF